VTLQHVYLGGEEVGDHAVEVPLPRAGVQQPARHPRVLKHPPWAEPTTLNQRPEQYTHYLIELLYV